MANFKRRRPRTRGGNDVHWLSTPAWWNIQFHSRPRRRKTRALERRALQLVDHDELVWPLGNSRPHKYYW